MKKSFKNLKNTPKGVDFISQKGYNKDTVKEELNELDRQG